MKQILSSFDETQVLKELLLYYLEKREIKVLEKEALLQYCAVSYDLLGLIGLLTNNLPRIILGKVCYNPFIMEKCKEIKHSLKDLEVIADNYLEIEHTEADEFVFRQIMLKYPRNLVDNNGNLYTQ